MKFYFKIHKTQYGNLIAICDKNLMGVELTGKDINFKVNSRFYGEEEIDELVEQGDLVEEMGKVRIMD